MSIRKHSEAQIIDALKQVDAGGTAAEVGRIAACAWILAVEVSPTIQELSDFALCCGVTKGLLWQLGIFPAEVFRSNSVPQLCLWPSASLAP